MQKYLLRQLTQVAALPDKDEIVLRHRERMRVQGWGAIGSDAILGAVRADRDDPDR